MAGTRVPDRGEIWHLSLDPSSGREMKSDHFCFIVSTKDFNKATNLAMLCPISNGRAEAARSEGLLVWLDGVSVTGHVHTHQLKSLDWKARKATYTDKAPQHITDEVLAKIAAILA